MSAPLPPPTGRWVASLKAAVVKAVRDGEISRESALLRYDLSLEEFERWSTLYDHGEKALKTTKLKQYRPAKPPPKPRGRPPRVKGTQVPRNST